MRRIRAIAVLATFASASGCQDPGAEGPRVVTTAESNPPGTVDPPAAVKGPKRKTKGIVTEAPITQVGLPEK